MNKQGDKARDIKVGKDILELLTSAMYINPLSVFREYIQNASDSIDEASFNKIYGPGEKGHIQINLDAKTRSIQIRDNGIGIPTDEVYNRLASFGASIKKDTNARGFRGIGRLAGLAYSQSVTFRTRGRGDSLITEFTWDCKALKKLLADPNFSGDLTELVRKITTLHLVDSKDYPANFFEVELTNVIRVKNDILLNVKKVEQYLSQHAPVPFSPEFSWSVKIDELLSEVPSKPNFLIFINDHESPVYRPFRDVFFITETQPDQFNEIETIKLTGTNGALIGIGWILHHEYKGALQSSSEIKGLRARVGDIQIGDHRIFEDIFPESRFNSWTVGELHIIDPRIKPNGRRDNFENSLRLSDLVNKLAPYGRLIASRCRESSRKRNQIKSYEIEEQKIQQRLNIIKQGAINNSAKGQIQGDIQTSFSNMKKITDLESVPPETNKNLIKRLDNLKEEYQKISNNVLNFNPLEKLPPKTRAVYEEIFSLIYECSPNKISAKSLVDKIMTRVSV